MASISFSACKALPATIVFLTRPVILPFSTLNPRWTLMENSPLKILPWPAPIVWSTMIPRSMPEIISVRSISPGNMITFEVVGVGGPSKASPERVALYPLPVLLVPASPAV